MEIPEVTALQIPSQSLPAVPVTIRELSTASQNAWIERLFQRFAALYGASFGRQWEGTNLADVKLAWAEKLGGFTARQVGGGIKACEEFPYPPNLPQFLTACRSVAQLRQIAVEEEKKIDKAQAAELLLEVKERAGLQEKPQRYKGWAYKLRERYLAGEPLVLMQIQMASEAINERWKDGKCLSSWE